MADALVNIEIDGKPLQARKGAMIIEVTDQADIYVPRFCYHKKLSIAANCRMCLVQVEKMPKPVPACATPVMEGMKVQTRSPFARAAQKATMEFLLINHPLDCPICDQGGECELQDLAMGYGADVSRFNEGKRVVKDKDLGPLIQTDMTRCIHCTRCVRFGEEIAGLRELGATGRGEHMEIGTYIEKAVNSEMSGNVIDVCPVGALTSKPYRYSARAWELRQLPGIAPHDGVGSHVDFHIKGRQVKRVVPHECEELNEVWLSDRDRYSYEGLHSPDRLLQPMIRENGRWRGVDWEIALQRVAEGMRRVVSQAGASQLGALISPSATVEEMYLLQKLMRGLGSQNIDHRLRQGDFRGEQQMPLYPGWQAPLAEWERLEAALLIGSNVRKEQPLANHRLRKAALRGAAMMVLNPVDFDCNWRVSEKMIVPPAAMPARLAAVARALAEDANDAAGVERFRAAGVEETHRRIASRLKSAKATAVILGPLAIAHVDFQALRTAAQWIAHYSGARLHFLAEGANAAGAWLAGAVPHRGPRGAAVAAPGLNAAAVLAQPRRGYVLAGIEPELDCWDGAAALKALTGAEFVVHLTAFRSPAMERHAHVMLPVAPYAENEGTYVNAGGRWQGFEAAVPPAGDARPLWKILRVLGGQLQTPGFDFVDCAGVRAELAALPESPGAIAPDNLCAWRKNDGALERATVVPMNAVDALVRHAEALQLTRDAADGDVRLNGATLQRIGVADGQRVRVRQQGETKTAVARRDDRVAQDVVLIHGGGPLADLGPAFGAITVERE
ncbi:MAG TPA: NADH-quinone oxidoreductase subunit NuoG [Gammaproteobacteria bacterium]|nr:NADH-quinone oxidoreductase subunit NuoG [Gammaproteobacteria bacterium]